MRLALVIVAAPLVWVLGAILIGELLTRKRRW